MSDAEHNRPAREGRPRTSLLLMAVVVLLGAGLAVLLFSSKPRPADASSGAPQLIVTVSFVPDDPTAYYGAHLGEWLKEFGLNEGRDYRMKSLSAQGDIATLSMLMDAARQERADILVTFQPQTLFNAIRRVPEIPKVFSILTAPSSLGAGESDTRHLSNVTGFYYWPDYGALMDLLRECKPSTKTLGTLFFAGDDESKEQIEKARQAAVARGIQLLAQAYTLPSDIPDAVRALAGRRPDAILLTPTQHQGLLAPALANAAADLKAPVATVLLDKVRAGTATLGYGVNQELAARKFAEILARVVRGAKPGDIPFFNGRNLRYETVINATNAAAIGLTLPEAVRKRADHVYE